MQPGASGKLIETLLDLPIFHAEWVLWLLLGLSVASIAVVVERWIFYFRHAADVVTLRADLTKSLDRGDFEAAARALGGRDSLEATVVLAGLRAYEKGPESVEDLIAGALGQERARYERRLGFLATLASNAPYIGLFGTVLGIVRSFKEMSTNMADAAAGIMGGIAEALIATAVGLLVAIPAVLTYNWLKGVVKQRVTDAEGLSRLVLAQLKAVDAPAVREAAE